MSISFVVSAHDGELLRAIADHAVALAKKNGIAYEKLDVVMDLIACHANGTPLRLQAMLAAAVEEDPSFGHDVFGIHRHIHRTTGKLGGCFLPRFAAPQHSTV